MARLSDIEVFVAVVDGGSFTTAASALGISKSYASRRVRALEDQLGARLLDRTTRRVSLTDAGRAYHDQVAPLLEGLADAEQAVAALQAEPRGTLRMAAPTSFGLRWLQPALTRFMERWPGLRVEISFNDRTIDLLADGFDLAIRGGRLADSTLVARRLAPFFGVVAASPAYLARRGRPEQPGDLLHHDCLDYSVRTSQLDWRFTGEGGQLSVPVKARMVADSGRALVVAAVDGLGICYQPDFELLHHIRSGALVQLLPAWRTWDAALYAIYPHRRHLSPKVRLLVEHMADEFAGPPWALA